MTDAELMEFLWPGHGQSPEGVARFIGGLSPDKRATFERMNDLCNDVELWQAGLAPKPDYAIICGPKQIKLAGIEKPERKTVSRAALSKASVEGV